MGAIKNELEQSLKEIFSDLDPTMTAEQKAEKIAAAVEKAILQGLQVKIPSGKVVIAATNAVMNPAEIDCTLKS